MRGFVRNITAVTVLFSLAIPLSMGCGADETFKHIGGLPKDGSIDFDAGLQPNCDSQYKNEQGIIEYPASVPRFVDFTFNMPEGADMAEIIVNGEVYATYDAGGEKTSPDYFSATGDVVTFSVNNKNDTIANAAYEFTPIEVHRWYVRYSNEFQYSNYEAECPFMFNPCSTGPSGDICGAPKFEFYAETDVYEQFEIDVATDPEFQNISLNLPFGFQEANPDFPVTPISDSPYSVETLIWANVNPETGTEFWWRVRGVTAEGETGDWCTHNSSFIQAGGLELLPSPLRPLDGAVVPNTEALIEWTGGDDFDWTLTVTEGSPDGNIKAGFPRLVSGEKSFLVNGLTEGNSYCWNISTDNPTCPSETEFQCFEMGTLTCAASGGCGAFPDFNNGNSTFPDNPACGADLCEISFNNISWASVEGVDHYRVYYADSNPCQDDVDIEVECGPMVNFGLCTTVTNLFPGSIFAGNIAVRACGDPECNCYVQTDPHYYCKATANDAVAGLFCSTATMCDAMNGNQGPGLVYVEGGVAIPPCLSSFAASSCEGHYGIQPGC